MRKSSVLITVTLSAFVFCGAQCAMFGSGPSDAEIALQSRIALVEEQVDVAKQRSADLAHQLSLANEELELLTDPTQIEQGRRIIADMEAQRIALAEQIKSDVAQRDLLEANRKVAEAIRLAAEANAAADTNTTINSILGLIPAPFGTIAAAILAVVAGFGEMNRRKAVAKEELAIEQRQSIVANVDAAKTSEVRSATGKVETATLNVTKLAELNEAAGVTAIVNADRAGV